MPSRMILARMGYIFYFHNWQNHHIYVLCYIQSIHILLPGNRFGERGVEHIEDIIKVIYM